MRSERPKKPTTVAGFLQRLRRRWLARRLFAVSALAAAISAHAAPAPTELPTGGQVVGGSAVISQNAATMTVQQNSARAAIDWNTFNVGQEARVTFAQPSASSVVLNRVLDSRPSEIFGNISANGQVFLVNPAGMYFSPTAQVDVGGLVATTHDIAPGDFMAGSTTFQRNGATGAVLNAGNLKAQLGGYIALLAPEVRNEGVIVAQLGSAVLAAGETITLNISGGRTLASITVTPSQIDALVENRNLVQAPGGIIILSARAANALQGAVVNSGTLEATGMAMRDGRIVLEASSRISNSGTVRADAGSDGPAGSLTLIAPEIVNTGFLSASALQATTFQAGGLIAMQATNIAQAAGGVIAAGSAAGSGGRITLDAENAVTLGGELRADARGDATGAGGEIVIRAGGDVALADAVVDASGAEAGGEVRVEAGTPLPWPSPLPGAPGTLTLTGSTQLRVGSRRSTGGSVTLTGDNVWLLDDTAIDASGVAGGGLVQVGGSWQNSDPSVRQATNTYVGQGVVIDASAVVEGDGGSIAVWSDITSSESVTRAFGTLLARGGSAGGDGGRIETSGYWLDVADITASASALNGLAGLWLLDPYNVYVANWATGDAYAPPNFTPTTQTSSILASTIIGQLNANTNVTISTLGTSAGVGDIIFASALTGITGSATLTANASAANVYVNAPINAGTALNLVFTGAEVQVTQAITTGGSLTVNNSGQFTTAWGLNLSANGGFAQTGAGLSSLGGNITTAGTALSFAGDLLLRNNVTLFSGGGNITLGGNVTSTATAVQTFTSSGTFSAATGSVEVLVVGGGGGGAGGGGGGGGVLYNTNATVGGATGVTVGAGGASYTGQDDYGDNGGNSGFGSLSALGGGGGSSRDASNTGSCAVNFGGPCLHAPAGLAGGSGGGASASDDRDQTTNIGGAGTLGQGNSGGKGFSGIGDVNGAYASGGGGGAGSAGTAGTLTQSGTGSAGHGGDGLAFSISGSSSYYGGGGGGSGWFNGLPGGNGGLGGGGAGGGFPGGVQVFGQNGTANTGGGGGGTQFAPNASLGNGGSGVVIVRYQTTGTSALTINAGAGNFTQAAGKSMSNMGAVSISANDVALNGSIAVAAPGAALQVSARNSVLVAASQSLSTQGGAITLGSDSDASGAGAIVLNATTVSSNGGAITLGGGVDPATGFAVGTAANPYGVHLAGAGGSLNSGGGNIVIRGRSFAGSASAPYLGVVAEGTVNSGAGTVYMEGISQGFGSANAQGLISAGTVTSASAASNAITLIGTYTGTTTAQAIGINAAGNILATNGGGITLTGTGGNSSFAGAAPGMTLANLNILSSGGPITLTGIAGTASSTDIQFSGNVFLGYKAATAVTASSSNITLNANTFSMTASDRLQSSGNLVIAPRTAGTTVGIGGAAGTLQLAGSYFSTNFSDGFSGITIGSTGAGAISLSGATAFSDALTFRSASDVLLYSASLAGAVGQNAALTLHADADASGAGGILVDAGSSITTNNGALVMGGGANPLTGYAQATAASQGSGIQMLGNVNTGTGNLTMNGRSALGNGIFFNTGLVTGNGAITINGISSYTTNADYVGGVRFFGAGTRLSTATGTVVINGNTPVSFVGPGNNTMGVLVNGGAVVETTGSGTLTFNATNDHGGSSGWGIGIWDGTVRSTGAGGGAITITANSLDWPLVLMGTGQVTSNGGDINLVSQQTNYSNGVFLDNTAVVNAGSGAINIVTNNLTLNTSGSLQGTGTLTVGTYTAGATIGIAGAAGNMALAANYFSNNFGNGFSSITIGSATTGAIAANGFSFRDNLTLWAGSANASVTLAGAIANAGTGTSSGSLTVKAAGDINVNGTITTQAQAVVLNSDSDAASGGAIRLGNNAGINSNGGAVTLGGGSNATGFATAQAATPNYGIEVGTGVNLLSGGGDLTLRGMSHASNFSGVSMGLGFWSGATTTLDAGSGKLSITGVSQGIGSPNSQGMAIPSSVTLSSSSSAADAITLSGSYTGTGTSYGIGLNISANVIASNGGGITLNGTGGAGAAGASWGIYMAANILANSGPITLNGIGGNASADIYSVGNNFIGYKAGSAVTASSSDITINANTLTLLGTDRLQSSGDLVIAPRTAGTTIGIGGAAGTLQLASSYFSTNFVDGFSSIAVGSSSAGQLNIAGATTYNDALTFKSASDVLLAGGASLTGGVGQNAALTFHADADASGAGGILINAGSSITTNNGDLVLGGGLNPLTGYAQATAASQGSGIQMLGNINAGTGNVTLNGRSALGNGIFFNTGLLTGNGLININGISSYTTNADYVGGVRFFGAGTRLSTATGTVVINGNTPASFVGPGNNTMGVLVNGGAVVETTGSGTLTFNATNDHGGSAGWGIGIWDGTVRSTGAGGGAITITANSLDWPLVLMGTGQVTSNGGAINLVSQQTNYSNGVFLDNTAVVNAGSGAINITANNLTLNASGSLQGTGALNFNPFTAGASIGIGGAAGSIQLAANYFSNNFGNGFSGITIGGTTTGNIASNGFTFRDNLTLWAGSANSNVTLAGTIANAGTGTSSGSLTVKAAGDITSTAAITTQNQAVVFDSDSDGSGVGAIALYSGASIASNGGAITLAGGLDPATGSAMGSVTNVNGIYADSTVVFNSGGGNILMRGMSDTGATGAVYSGVYSESTINSGSGTITIDGVSRGTGAANKRGVSIYGTIASANTTANAITITGSNANANASWSAGIQSNATITATNGGGITLTGTGGTTSAGGNSAAGLSFTSTSILANGGPITLNGIAGTGSTDLRSWDGNTIGYKAATAVTSSTSNITLNLDTLTLQAGDRLQSSGTLTIAPRTAGTTVGIGGAAGTLQLAGSYFATNFVNGFSSVTVGSAGTGNLASNGFTFSDNLTLWAGNANATATLAGAIANAGTGTSSGTLTVKAAGDISTSAAITTQAQAVLLNSNSDAVGTGAIHLLAGSSISSNGGAITLGGGINATGYAVSGSSTLGYGIDFGGSVSLLSGGGDITLRGQSYTGQVTAGYAMGIVMQYGNDTINAGTGKISLTGISTGNGSSNSQGIALNPGSTLISNSTAADAITLTGTYAGSGTTSYGLGTNFQGTALAGNGGGIVFTGTGGAGGAGISMGIYLGGAVLANTGAITLTGTAGNGSSPDIYMTGGATLGYKAATAITASSSNITLNANSVTIQAGDRLQSSGTLTIAPRTAGTTVGLGGAAGTLQLAGSYFATNFVNGFSSITVGGTTAGDIALSGATTYNDALTLMSAGNIVMNASASLAGGVGQNAALTFNADADANSSGGIQIGTGTSITSNNGNVVLGGGATPATGYAWGTGTTGNAGINVLGNITTGSGNLTLNGRSGLGDGIALAGGTVFGNGTLTFNGITTYTGNSGAMSGGVAFRNSGTRLSTATGTVVVNGSMPGATTGSGSYAAGILIDGGAVVETTGSGTLTFTGTQSSAATPWNLGIGIKAGTVRSTAAGGGAINFTGSSVGDTGVLMRADNGAINVTSNGGDINITATTSAYTGFEFGGTFGATVSAGSGNITVRADKANINANSNFVGTGTITLAPYTTGGTVGINGAAGTLQVSAAVLSSYIANGFNSVVIGSNTTGNLASNGFSFRDNLTLWAGNANANVSLAGAIANVGAGTDSGSLTVKAAGNISSSAAITTQAQAVILNSDSDGSGAGAIAAGGSISSNGGAITLGGGSGAITAGSGFARGHAGNITGISITGAIAAGGGDIIINGAGDAVTNGVSRPIGVAVQGGGSVSTTGSGDITITGQAMNSGPSSLEAWGIAIGVPSAGAGTVSVADGDLVLNGTGSGITNAIGTLVYTGTVQAAGSGTVSVYGTAGNGVVSSGYTRGVDIESAGIVRTNSGALLLDGNNTSAVGTTGTAYGVHINGQSAGDSRVESVSGDITIIGARLAGVGVDVMVNAAVTGNLIGNGTSGDITVLADTVDFSGARFSGTGTLTIAPRTAGTTVGIGGAAGTLQLAGSYFATNFVNGFSGITIGDGSAGTLSASGATTYYDALTFKTADDVLLYSASLTGAAGQLADLTLHADADASGAGGILVDSGSSITTNDGALVMGGGAVALTGYAQATGATQNSGIQMLGNVDAGIGAVTLNGQSDIGSGIFFNTGLLTGNGLITINGITTFTFDADYIAGVRFFGVGTRLSTATGTVIVNGNTPLIVTGTGNNAMGVMVSNGAVVETTGSGTLTLNGSNDHGGNWGWGVGLYDGTVRSTAVGGGALNLNGVSLDWDVVLFGTSQVTSNGGAVNITARSPDYWNGFAVTDAAVVNAGSGALTVTANSMTLSTSGQLQGTGALTIRNYSAGASIGIGGGAGDFQIAGSYFGSNIADGFSSITVGGETTGNLASNGFIFRDHLTLWAGVANSDVTLAGAIANAGTGTSSGALTVKAAGNIVSSAAITTQAQSVVFNSNSDTVGTGAISVFGGSIATNGGAIVLGGGADPMTDRAIGVAGFGQGIRVDAASTLDSAGGNISLLGASSTGTTGNLWGVYADGSISSGAGTILIDGISYGTLGAHTIAVSLGGTVTSTNTSANAITVTGLVSPGGTVTSTIGVNLYGTVQATNGGGIAFTGTSGITSDVAYGEGIYLGNANVLANGGPITLTATAPTAGITDITMAGNVYIGQKAGSAVTVSTSDITLNVNDITLSAGNFLQSGGDLVIAPRTAGTTIGIGGGAGTLQIASTHFSSTFVNGFASITIGDATAGDLTVGGAITGSDGLALVTGGAIALDAPITLGVGDTLTLTAASTVAGNGNLVAGNLLLNGAAAYSLATATANNIGTLAATGIASLDFRDSNALTVGTVDGVNGVAATGAISIVTASGDLTVAQGIATTDTSSSAIVLNAGQSAAAGTATGGDLIISAALTTGAGGRALLYTGSVAGSTGVAGAAGAGHYRYNSDEVATNFAAALGSDGIWAIYREQPTVTVTAAGDSKTYDGVAYSGGNGVGYGGFVNGEDETVLTGTLAYGGDAQGAINAGSYAIGVSGLGNDLGYALSFVDGALTIGARGVTVTADAGQTKTYGAADAVFAYTLTDGTLIGSDTFNGELDRALGEDVGLYAIGQGSLDLGDNYTITFVGDDFAITPADLLITAANATKTYGNAVAFAGTEFTSSGLQFGETVGSVVLTSDGAAATAAVGSGSYDILASGATGGTFNSSNYDITYQDGTLTVNRALLTVTADNRSKTYGSAVTFAGTEFTTSLLQNADAIDSVSLSSDGAAATAAVGSGSYDILVSAATGTSFDANNYDITYDSGVLTVNRALLTVTADNLSKTYGSAMTFAGTEFTTSLLQNADAIDSVSLSSGGAAATAAVGSGSYDILVSAATGASFDANNYDITYDSGVLTVNQATLTITASDAAKIYGQTLAFSGSEFTSVGLQNGEAIGSVTLDSDGAAAIAAVGDGSHDILVSTATGGTFDIANYSVTYVAGELILDRAALTITADNAAKLYGQTVTFGGGEFSSVGLQNGETIGGVSLASTGAVATAGVAAGPYAIVASGAAGGSFDIANYDVTYADGTLTVNRTTLTVTAVALSRNFTGAAFYGGDGVTFSGFVNGEDSAVLGGTLAYGGGSQGAIAPATYVLTPLGFASDNYTLLYVDGTLTILPGLLLVPPPVVVPPPIVIAPSTSFGTPSLGYGSTSSAGSTTSAVTTSTSGTTASTSGTGTTSTSGTATTGTAGSGATGSTAGAPGTLGTTGGTTTIGTTTGTQPGMIAIPAISVDTGPIATAATVAAAAAAATSSGAGATASGTGSSSGGSTTTAGSGVSASGTGSSAGSTTTSTATTGTTASSTSATGTSATGTSAAGTSGGTTTSTTSTASAAAAAGTGTGTSSGSTSGTAPTSTAGTGTTSGTSTSGSTTASSGTGSTSASGSGTSVATSGTATTAGVTGEATSAATTPATVATVSTSIAGADAPATVLESFTSSRVDAAIASGMAPAQAQQAGTAYTETLTQLLAQGVPMGEAVTRAEQIFQAEAAFPAVTPQQAMGASLATGGDALVSQINSLSGAQSGAGTAAFDVVLASALAEGMSFAEAVSTAQVAARVADSLARADATPQSMLASGNPEAAAAAFASTSADYQQAFSEALAQGVPLEQAMARADAVAQSAAAGAVADARSPAVALASGNPGALPQGIMKSGTYDRALQAALAKGLSLEEAIAQAAKADAWEQQVAIAEARNVAYGFSSGSMLLPVADAVFDQALTNAIARGVPPAEALAIARAAAAKSAAVKPSATTALASGSGNEVLLFLVGSSRTFRMTLSNALARGLSVEKAIELAKRAEAANAFRFRLPPEIARQLPARGTVTVITASGKPLPAWLAFSLRLREFVAVEVPEGGLPVPVVIRAGTQRFAITVSEGPVPQQQPQALARRPAFTPVKK